MPKRHWELGQGVTEKEAGWCCFLACPDSNCSAGSDKSQTRLLKINLKHLQKNKFLAQL